MRRLTVMALTLALAAAAQAQMPTRAPSTVLVPVAPGTEAVVRSPLVAPGTTAGATFASMTPAEVFATADSDRNGVLTRAEAQALVLLPKPFEDMDLNKDGSLNLDEYGAGLQQ